MSHVTTIARDGTKRTGTPLVGRLGAMALSLAVGVAIGYTVVELGGADSGTPQDAATAAAHEEFLRLNTTALAFSPAKEAAPVASATATPVDHFTRINTIDLENLAPSMAVPAVDANFLEWNIAALEGMEPFGTRAAEQAAGSGYDFTYWNVGSLERPESAYSESATGPR